MAKKSTERAAWEVDWYQINLPRESIEACKKWDADYTLTFKVIDDCLIKACKITVSYNVTTDSYIASLTIPSPVDGVRKKCMSSHAPDMLDAMKLMAYKVVEGLGGDPFNAFREDVSDDVWR